MNGRVNRKVVTSGRLAGPLSPESPALPEPVYSLYSTDSEDQVTTLHKDLDQCADVLSGILQMDQAASRRPPRALGGGATAGQSQPGRKNTKRPQTKSASLGPARAVKGGVVKSRPLKVMTRKLASKTEQQSSASDRPGPAVKVPPLQRRALHPPSDSVPPHRSSVPPHRSSVSRTASPRPVKLPGSGPGPDTRNQCDGEEELVPVKDTNVQRSATPVPAPGPEPDPEPDPGLLGGGRADTEAKAETVRFLLEELKTLITVRGSAAERLLGLLEQTVSSLQASAGAPTVRPERHPDVLLQDWSAPLPRSGGIQDEPAREREVDEHQKPDPVLGLQDQLGAAQARLQNLQEDFAGLRENLQDSRSRLRDAEAQNALLKTDLQDTRKRLQDSEQERRELAHLAQRRLEETADLRRLLQTRRSSFQREAEDDPPSAGNQQPSAHITQYLLSLGPTGDEELPKRPGSGDARPSGQDLGLQGSRVQDLGLQGSRVQDLGLQGSRVQDLGLQGSRVQDLGLQGSRVQDLGLQGSRVQDLGLQGSRVQDLGLQGSRVQDLGLQGSRVQDLGLQGSRVQDLGLQGSREQDLGLQGSRVQDLGLQGSRVQDLGLQGSRVQDLGLQGSRVQDLGLQGSRVQDLGLQGSRVQDLGLQGSREQDLGLQGSRVQDLGLQGSRVQDLGLQGSRVQDLGLQGSRVQDLGLQRCNSTTHSGRESLCSHWSLRTGSTFNTRDEAAFQDGLEALDASIASLQKTLQLDLRK